MNWNISVYGAYNNNHLRTLQHITSHIKKGCAAIKRMNRLRSFEPGSVGDFFFLISVVYKQLFCIRIVPVKVQSLLLLRITFTRI